MSEKKIRLTIFSILISAGLFMMYTGITYNLAYFDTQLTGNESFYILNRVDIGYITITIAPLVIKKYIWSVILLGIAAIFFAYGYFVN